MNLIPADSYKWRKPSLKTVFRPRKRGPASLILLPDWYGDGVLLFRGPAPPEFETFARANRIAERSAERINKMMQNHLSHPHETRRRSRNSSNPGCHYRNGRDGKSNRIRYKGRPDVLHLPMEG